MIECDSCFHKHHECKRGAESEAQLYRVIDAVVSGNTPKLYFCDRACYLSHAEGRRKFKPRLTKLELQARAKRRAKAKTPAPEADTSDVE